MTHARWQPGDVVMDAEGAVWTRTADGRWSYPGGEPGPVAEPLTLLLGARRAAGSQQQGTGLRRRTPRSCRS